MPHIPDSHADHDPLAIAAYAAGDATGPELDDALALVAACPDCAALHHDLRAIAAAVLPAPVRPRDFRLTPGQAAALRPSGWRRVLAPLAGPRFAFAGPLGTGLATLGIAGLLVAGSLGAPVAAPATADGNGGAAATDGAPSTVEMAPERAAEPLQGTGQASAAPVEGPAEIPAPAASGVTAPVEGAGTDTSAGEASPGPAAAGPNVVAASPAAEGYAASGGDAEASQDVVRAAAPSAEGDRTLTADVPGAETAPVSVVLPVLALVMLAAGLLLAGARLLARRLA